MIRLRLLLALALVPSLLPGQGPAPLSLESYTLPNGLRVILAPDRTTQVVTVDVWYDVGSRNEVRSRTGFAHLFEHMMFQGSAHVEKAEHFQLVERAGGESNGSTSEDRTNYYQTLPSNRVNLGLWLEADRMRSLTISEENFENQRQAVKEERRLRVDNQPYVGAIFEGMYGLADSTRCFPYSHSIIGSMADLDAARTGDVQAFFDLYYAPNNATLAVVGDFDPAAVKAMVQQYFGSIPRGQTPPPVRCDQPFSSGEIRRRWPDSKANLPGVLLAYRIPGYQHEDTPALSLLSTILGQGESSRINQRVVRERQLAQFSVSLLNPAAPRRGPGVFLTLGVVNAGVTADSLEHALAAEFARVAESGVTEDELTKAKNAYRTRLITERQQSLFVAEAIQTANLFLGDPAAVNTDWQRYLAVTVDDLKRVAAKYLRPDNSLALLIVPEGQ